MTGKSDVNGGISEQNQAIGSAVYYSLKYLFKDKNKDI